MHGNAHSKDDDQHGEVIRHADSRIQLERLQANDTRFVHQPPVTLAARQPSTDVTPVVELSGEFTGVVQGHQTCTGSVYSSSLQEELTTKATPFAEGYWQNPPPSSHTHQQNTQLPSGPGHKADPLTAKASTEAQTGASESSQDSGSGRLAAARGRGDENGWGEESSGEEEEAPVDVVPQNQRVVLGFSNVEVWVPTTFQDPGVLEKVGAAVKRRVVAAASKGQQGEGGKGTAAVKDTRRQVLWGITGKVQPGEVLALMGPSGSGKTTLLSVIGGRVPQRVDYGGAITANGRPLTKAVRRHIGFVLQDDVLYESLTVWETLVYAALLRLPRDTPREQMEQRVKDVMAALGLEKTSNTIIGGYMRRGVSGGERKRVSIGHELLTNPAVLLLDEPTSGLDSTTALYLLTTLRRLANEGRAVLTTIHQPSSRIYQKLDQLMLLSEGKVMYVGNAHRVVEWFEHYGFRLPYGVNTADFIMDVAMGTVKGGTKGGQTLTGRQAVTSLSNMFEAWYTAGGFVGFQKDVEEADMPKLLPAGSGAMDQADGKKEGLGDKVVNVVVVPDEGAELFHARNGASYIQQFSVLLSRAFRVRRFEAFTGMNFGQMLAVAIVAGLLWWQRGSKGDMSAANDIMGLLFFALLFPAMRSLFTALFTFPNEYRMLLKERPSGMYKLSAYYFARTISDIPVELVMPILFSTIIYWFGGLRHSAEAFIGYLLTIVLVVFVGQSWGLLIGGSFMDPKMAQAVTTVVMLSFLLVSGFYVRNVPNWIEWLRYLSFFYWGYNLLLKLEFKHRTFVDCGFDGKTCRTITDLKSALELPVSPNSSVWPEVVALFGMLVLLRLATYYVLRNKTRGRKI